MDPIIKTALVDIGKSVLASSALGAVAGAGMYSVLRMHQPLKKHNDSNNSTPATLSVSPSPAGLHLNIDIPAQSLQGLKADTFTRSKIN